MDRPSLGFDPRAEVGILDAARGNEVDRPPEEPFDAFLQAEAGISVGLWRQLVELDEEIDALVAGSKSTRIAEPKTPSRRTPARRQ